MDLLVAHFGYRYVSIYTVDGPLMRLGAQRGYDEVIESFDGSIGVVGRVMRTGKPELVRDISTDPDYAAANADVRSEVSVPLAVDGVDARRAQHRERRRRPARRRRPRHDDRRRRPRGRRARARARAAGAPGTGRALRPPGPIRQRDQRQPRPVDRARIDHRCRGRRARSRHHDADPARSDRPARTASWPSAAATNATSA